MKRKPQDEKSALVVPPKGVEILPVGLKIKGKLSYEEWADLVQTHQRLHRVILWRLGDLLVWGEDAFGEEFSQVISDYAKQTQYNAMWVARRVDFSRRREILSWSHHAEVAHLPADEQDKFLELATEKRWKVVELRQAIRLSKVPEPRLDFHDEPEPPAIPVQAEPEFADMEVRPQRYYPEYPERVVAEVSSEKASADGDLRHLIDLCRALRTAVLGDLSRGVKPDAAAASRYWGALDAFLARFA